MDFLKPKKYYEDRYDLHTIEECLRTLQKTQDTPLPNQHLMPTSTVSAITNDFAELINYLKAGERYRNRASTIEKWIAEDQEKQNYFDRALDPSPILCPECYEVMHCFDKILQDPLDKPLRVLFLFECSKCKKGKGIYDDGEEYISQSKYCPKCKGNLSTIRTRKDNSLRVVSNCTKCDYKDTLELNLKVDNSEYEKKEKKEALLLEKYKDEFCLTPERGQEYLMSTERTKSYLNQRTEEQFKQSDPVWQKVKELKKLSIVEIEALLVRTLEPLKYIRFSLDKPEMDKFLTVQFTVQQADASKSEYDSVHNLQKAIKSVLEDTNWRLMSEGITYRLGYLVGRLKGYEREEDLHGLIVAVNKKRM